MCEAKCVENATDDSTDMETKQIMSMIKFTCFVEEVIFCILSIDDLLQEINFV